MGLVFSRIWERMVSKKQHHILMVGLDAAGKTTILYKFKLGEVVSTIPTIGFNVETIEHKNISFTVWDVGGQEKIRPLWRHYFQNTTGLIFVVDSNDPIRIDAARYELHRLLNENEELCGAAVLIFANKQDLPNAMSTSEMTDKLGLHCLRPSYRPWYIQACCATTGDGLYEGLDWLSGVLSGAQVTRNKTALSAVTAPAPPIRTPPPLINTPIVTQNPVALSREKSSPSAASPTLIGSESATRSNDEWLWI